MNVISADQVHQSLSWPSLLDALQLTFGGTFTMPPRNVMRLDDATHDAFALLPVRTMASQSPPFVVETVVSSHGVVTGAPAFTIAAAVVMLESTVQRLPRSAEVKSSA